MSPHLPWSITLRLYFPRWHAESRKYNAFWYGRCSLPQQLINRNLSILINLFVSFFSPVCSSVAALPSGTRKAWEQVCLPACLVSFGPEGKPSMVPIWIIMFSSFLNSDQYYPLSLASSYYLFFHSSSAYLVTDAQSRRRMVLCSVFLFFSGFAKKGEIREVIGVQLVLCYTVIFPIQRSSSTCFSFQMTYNRFNRISAIGRYIGQQSLDQAE